MERYKWKGTKVKIKMKSEKKLGRQKLEGKNGQVEMER